MVMNENESKTKEVLEKVRKELARIIYDLREYEDYAKEHEHGAVFYSFVRKIRNDLSRIFSYIILNEEAGEGGG